MKSPDFNPLKEYTQPTINFDTIDDTRAGLIRGSRIGFVCIWILDVHSLSHIDVILPLFIFDVKLVNFIGTEVNRVPCDLLTLIHVSFLTLAYDPYLVN